MNKFYNTNDLKIGFIGCGKMASAIIKGVITSGFVGKNNLMGSEIDEQFAQEAKVRLAIEVISDNKILVKDSDVIFIATKPNYVVSILEEIKEVLTEDKLVVSIAAGVKTAKIEAVIPNRRIVRVMPNTPALVGEGMSGVCGGSCATDEDIMFVVEFLSKIGKAIVVNESQIDIVTAISGSGPAFFYKVIEEIARAGEKLGLDYEKSLILATQTALGSAKMVFNRGELPVQTLIDNVATKGGCTFVGVSTMNEMKSKELFFEVIEKTTNKAAELGGN